MNKKLTLAHVSDLTTIISNLPDVIAFSKNYVNFALSGSVATYAVNASGLPNYCFWTFIGISSFTSCLLLRKPVLSAIAAIKATNSEDGALEFSTTYTNVVLDIAPNCKNVRLLQKRLVTCLKPNIPFYTYKYQPAEVFSNFRHNIGSTSWNIIGEIVEVKVEFETPLVVGQSCLFELSADLVNPFPAENEFWYLSKYYIGSEAFHLQIKFPKKRFPISYSAELIPLDGVPQQIPVKPHISRKTKPSLILDLPELKEGEDVFLYFKW